MESNAIPPENENPGDTEVTKVTPVSRFSIVTVEA